MGEMQPKLYNPEEIKKMISPRERANDALASLENQITKMLEEGDLTQEDWEGLYRSVGNRKRGETTH